MALARDVSTAEVVALVSGSITVAAAFLPWVTAGMTAGPVEVRTASSGIQGLGILSLVLGGAVSAGLGLSLTLLGGLGLILAGLWEYGRNADRASPEVAQ